MDIEIEKLAATIAALSTIVTILWAAIQRISGAKKKPADEMLMLQTAKLRHELASIDPKIVEGIPRTFGHQRTDQEEADDKRKDFRWAFFVGWTPSLLFLAFTFILWAFENEPTDTIVAGGAVAGMGLVATYLLARLLTRTIKSDVVRPIVSFFLGGFVMIGCLVAAIAAFG